MWRRSSSSSRRISRGCGECGLESDGAEGRPGAQAARFTLIELLVVVAVIALLAAVLMPVYQRVTESGRATACVSNLRQISVALKVYLADHNNTMPALKAGREKLTDESR